MPCLEQTTFFCTLCYSKINTIRLRINMLHIKKLWLLFVFVFVTGAIHAETCCDKMGGINYCDSSSGQLVCQNGFYSACYCDRHAVMDLQLLKGCCLWKGGVSPAIPTDGKIMCNDGSSSEECSITKSYNKSSGIY